MVSAITVSANTIFNGQSEWIGFENYIEKRVRSNGEVRWRGVRVMFYGDTLIPSAAKQRVAEIMTDAKPMDVLVERNGRAPDGLQWLSTHPVADGRADAARAADVIGEAPFTPVLNDDEWLALQQICD